MWRLMKIISVLPKWILLIGDYSKAKQKLGWQPKTTFNALAKLMVDADVKLVQDHLSGKGRVAS